VTFLLDVNVLIALIDAAHVSHDTAHDWFARQGGRQWATCPLTENGVIRIVGNPRYPNSPGTPAAVAGVLSRLRLRRGHQFWADDISLLNPTCIDPSRLLTHTRVTDSYLLALAIAHGGKLATWDRRLVVAPVLNGIAALHLIQ
jgi:toxin-antitoxin system PIN domain toxin